MENISLGQIVTILSFLSVLIGVITSVITFFKLFITKSPIQKQNAFELYDRYQELGGNSYIHDKWEKLIKENKI